MSINLEQQDVDEDEDEVEDEDQQQTMITTRRRKMMQQSIPLRNKSDLMKALESVPVKSIIGADIVTREDQAAFLKRFEEQKRKHKGITLLAISY